MKAPFPWFGGKSRITPEVWRRFGAVKNYVEPFCGSLAMLLGRPGHHLGTETVNDLDGYLVNFWRSVRFAPDETAYWADYPVSEVDLLARHDWLLGQRERLLLHMREDPDYYNPKIGGWWVWGLCQWIGSGWCQTPQNQLPHLGDGGQGINRKLPHLGDGGRGAQIRDHFSSLSDRLRDVRIACGDWARVTGPSVTHKHGLTALFLDPPYGEGNMDYATGGNEGSLWANVQEWAIVAGQHPEMRIALCGYTGGASMPDGWTAHKWKAKGGYGNQADAQGRTNRARECIWFSPHCLQYQLSFFAT